MIHCKGRLAVGDDLILGFVGGGVAFRFLNGNEKGKSGWGGGEGRETEYLAVLCTGIMPQW